MDCLGFKHFTGDTEHIHIRTHCYFWRGFWSDSCHESWFLALWDGSLTFVDAHNYHHINYLPLFLGNFILEKFQSHIPIQSRYLYQNTVKCSIYKKQNNFDEAVKKTQIDFPFLLHLAEAWLFFCRLFVFYYSIQSSLQKKSLTKPETFFFP